MTVRYTELANNIVRMITDGEIPVGAKLPSEVAMAEQYGVSRTTVRSALNIVESLGLISRKRRKGTVVVAQDTSQSYTKSLQNIEALVHYANNTLRRIINVNDVVADDDLAQALECRPGQRWVKVQMLRTEKNAARTPVCWTDAYLEPEVARQVLPLIDDGEGLVSQIIERVTGIAVFDIMQQIDATALSPEVARNLGSDPGAPALKISRHYLDRARRTFFISVNTYPSGKFKFTSWMHRAPAVEL